MKTDQVIYEFVATGPEAFRVLTAEAIWSMRKHLTPLDGTRACQLIVVKGEADGKAEDIKRPLTRRFGPLPPWAGQRITAAADVQLGAWLDTPLDADSVAALIGPQGGPAGDALGGLEHSPLLRVLSVW